MARYGKVSYENINMNEFDRRRLLVLGRPEASSLAVT